MMITDNLETLTVDLTFTRQALTDQGIFKLTISEVVSEHHFL